MSYLQPFKYKDSRLVVNSKQTSFDLLEFAKSQDHPFYMYNLEDIDYRYRFLDEHLKFNKSIHYAMKANCHPKILSHLKSLGSGVDVVSAGEIQLALNAGFKGSDVIFSGVGKTKSELLYAFSKGIKQINVESLPELKRILELSRDHSARIAVALRLNPDVNPVTHPYITTGFRENKFGMDASQVIEALSLLKDSEYVELNGLTLHIGSQLLELSAMTEAIDKSLDLCQQIENQGFKLKTLDIGGGVGVYYNASPDEDFKLVEEYSAILNQRFSDCPFEVLLEPGRLLVARSGILVGEIQYIKETQNKTFVILDTGMNHLMRPALYQAYHNILPVEKRNEGLKVYDVVGPICESSDSFGKDRPLPKLEQGDYLAIADAGAYGAVMANNYNAHGLPQEFVWWQGDLLSDT